MRYLGTLDLTRRVAKLIVQRRNKGLPITRRSMSDDVTQIMWWRGVEMLRYAGVIKRGKFVEVTPEEAEALIDAEHARAEERIHRQRAPKYTVIMDHVKRLFR